MALRRGGGGTDDEVGRDDGFAVGGPFAFEVSDGRRNGTLGESEGVLPDGGEIDMGEAGEAGVIEANDGDFVGDGDAGAQEGVKDAGGAVVVEGKDGGGTRSAVEERTGGCGPVVLGEPAR